MKKYKTQANADEYPKKHERKTKGLPSMTIPNQSKSVKEILDRFAVGLPFEGAKVVVYDGEIYAPSPEEMDIAEREAYALEVFSRLEMQLTERDKRIEENRKKLEEEKLQKIKDQLREEIKKEVRIENP